MHEIIQDIQLANRAQDRWYFICATVTKNGRNLTFIATLVRFDAKEQENVELSRVSFDASKFSAWWNKKRKAGWRICL